MPIPPIIFSQIMQMVVRLAPLAYRARKLIRKVDVVRIGSYEVTITRRGILGSDGGISQMVKILKNLRKEEVWHMVVRAGKIIHKDLK